MSYDRMQRREAELVAEVDRWLNAAEAADADEDRQYGAQRGDEMPAWVADKEKRLAKLRAAKAALEAEASAAAEEETRRQAAAKRLLRDAGKTAAPRRRPTRNPTARHSATSPTPTAASF
jgi:hypothetical protein